VIEDFEEQEDGRALCTEWFAIGFNFCLSLFRDDLNLWQWLHKLMIRIFGSFAINGKKMEASFKENPRNMTSEECVELFTYIEDFEPENSMPSDVIIALIAMIIAASFVFFLLRIFWRLLRSAFTSEPKQQDFSATDNDIEEFFDASFRANMLSEREEMLMNLPRKRLMSRGLLTFSDATVRDQNSSVISGISLSL